MTPFYIARNSIDLLLSSKKREKRSLCIYGGEPLLYPSLTKQILRYGRLRSGRLGRSLNIACCSNALLLDEAILKFFRRYEVVLNISLFAQRKEHDNKRLNVLGKGTFDCVVKNIFLAKSILPQRLLSVSLCISPGGAKDLEKDIMFVRETFGIVYFNLELVKMSSCRWTDLSVSQFVSSFKGLIDELIRGIEEDKFFFIGALSRELSMGQASISSRMYDKKISSCPKRLCLEVYPDGGMSFSGFLQNSPDRNKYLLGNVRHFEKSRIADCDFYTDSSVCRDCIRSYLVDANARPHEVLLDKYHHKLIIQAAALLKKYARRDPRFSRYIRLACASAY